MLEFIAAEGLIDHVDPVQYAIRLLVPPGSMLLDRPAIQPYLDSLDQAAFTYRWTHRDPRMDDLQRAVSAVVEEAARADEDPAITFERVRALAYTAHGERRLARVFAPLSSERSRPPRLTEPWFC
jgi:hypothetical protein